MTVVASLLKEQFFLAYMALMAVLSEVLTVAISGVPFNSSQSYTAHLVSSYLSVTILVLMLIGLVWVLLRQDDLVLPYHVDRILSVLLYLCNSEMIHHVGDLSSLDTKTRNRRILNMGRTYKFGVMEHLSGRRSYGIGYCWYHRG
jgi:hypothetical protein